jgi:guanylate kinase
MTGLAYRPFPIVLSAPSGTGKTTLAHHLVEQDPRFCFSVSATTREPRPGEENGVDYHFLGRPEFEAMVERGELAEWAEVHGELYGTPRKELTESADRGRHVVLDIDVQGARQIRMASPEAILVFVLPPSVEDMLDRLQGRGTEGHAKVGRRLVSALAELESVEQFDYVVVNDDLDRCVEIVKGLVEGESARGERITGLSELVDQMRSAVGRVLNQEYQNVITG